MKKVPSGCVPRNFVDPFQIDVISMQSTPSCTYIPAYPMAKKHPTRGCLIYCGSCLKMSPWLTHFLRDVLRFDFDYDSVDARLIPRVFVLVDVFFRQLVDVFTCTFLFAR
jgi:hypothetical protein